MEINSTCTFGYKGQYLQVSLLIMIFEERKIEIKFFR